MPTSLRGLTPPMPNLAATAASCARIASAVTAPSRRRATAQEMPAGPKRSYSGSIAVLEVGISRPVRMIVVPRPPLLLRAARGGGRPEQASGVLPCRAR